MAYNNGFDCRREAECVNSPNVVLNDEKAVGSVSALKGYCCRATRGVGKGYCLEDSDRGTGRMVDSHALYWARGVDLVLHARSGLRRALASRHGDRGKNQQQ